MTFEDYARNLRGLNDGKDFRPGYLKEIYETIKQDEIVMPEEHEGELGFNYTWKCMMNRAKQVCTYIESILIVVG
jgi:brefeldin A-resistance guanine nucleotide exchange factor 1